MSTPLQVAVNLLWLAPGRVGGSEEYLVRQLAGLDAASGCHPTLYCRPDLPAAHPHLTGRYPTVTPRRAPGGRPARIALEHTWLAAHTRRADVVHHGGGTAPLVGGRPIVLTVHDLQYLELPHYFGRARRSYLAAMMPRAVARAAVVATPSAFVRRSVLDAFGADPERVVVVPHGVPDLSRPSQRAIDAARRRYGVDRRPYVVYPAITHPHKAHRVLVEMMEHLPPPTALVLTGGAGAAESDLQAAIAGGRHADRIVRTGRIPAADRDALVAGADAMTFPSEYEGFGAPLVEAMALDVPVVAGDHGAVREVVGDAAVIVTDPSGPAWADAVGRARVDREQLVARGRRRRAAYTLAESGAALAAAYRLAVDHRAQP